MNKTSYDTTNVSQNSSVSTNSLLFISEFVTRCVVIPYIIFGSIGNILNIFLFTCPALFRTSSSLYLLSASIANLFVIIFVLPMRLAADGFDQDITSFSLLSCRLVSYIYYVCLALPSFFTVLACADRWAASCVQVNKRRFATARIAKRCIPLAIILCCILYSHIFVTFNRSPQPPPPYCSVNDSYAVFGLTFQLIIYSLIPPFLMALFSICIILNVLGKRNRVMPAIHAINTSTNRIIVRRNRRRLSQMQVMLVVQAIAEFFLTLPFSIINLISIVVNDDEYFLSIYSFCRLFIFLNYVSSFYVYTLSSQLYRDELKHLVERLFNRH
jgi:hypothetical protein